MHADQRASIIKELEEGGFGSELKARRIFQKEGFFSEVVYFHDKDEDQTRELDIRATPVIEEIVMGGGIFHTIVAEVKSGYIWVLGDEGVDTDEDVIINQFSPQWFKDMPPARSFRDPEWQELEGVLAGEHLEAKTSTSIHQKKTEKGGEAWFEAAVKVFKAAAELDPAKSWGDTDFFRCIPLVILDGNLLVASFLTNGDLSLESREHAQVLFSYASAKYLKKNLLIHVVTLDGLATFLKKVLKDSVDGSALGKKLYSQVRAENKGRPSKVTPRS